MTVLDLIHQTRDTLQDADGDYWSDSELLNYYNSGVRVISAKRLETPTTKTIALTTDVHEYTVSGVLRYISATDSDDKERVLYQDDTSGNYDNDGIVILDYDKIYVNNPVTDVTLSMKTVALPIDSNLSSAVRSGDELAMEYYMCSKSYRKESDMENYGKSNDFMALYRAEEREAMKHSRLGFVKQTETTQGYYF